MEITDKELQETLDNHKKWLNGEGEARANLRDADLRGASLEDANLRNTDLRYANLKGAKLRHADLKGTDLDFSCLPLCCGGLNIHIDERLFKQLLYHALQNALYSENVNNDIKEKIRNSGLIELANKSHIVTKYGREVLK